MADKKFEQYTEETAPTNDDLVLIKEKTSGSTRRVQLQNILPNGSVTNAKLANNTVTPAKWINPYRFRAYRNAVQSISATTTSKVAFDAESYDYSTNFDSATNNRFTAAVTGTHRFNAAVTATVAGGDLYQAFLYKNGTLHSSGSGTIPGTGTADQTFVVSDEIDLAPGDYVEVFFRNGSGGSKSLVAGSTKTYFSGSLVSQG